MYILYTGLYRYSPDQEMLENAKFQFTLRLSLDSPNQSVAFKLLTTSGTVNSMNVFSKGRRGSQSSEESHSRAPDKVKEKRREEAGKSE